MTGCCLRVSLHHDNDDADGAEDDADDDDNVYDDDDKMTKSLQDGVMYKPGARFYDEATGSTLVNFFISKHPLFTIHQKRDFKQSFHSPQS